MLQGINGNNLVIPSFPVGVKPTCDCLLGKQNQTQWTGQVSMMKPLKIKLRLIGASVVNLWFVFTCFLKCHRQRFFEFKQSTPIFAVFIFYYMKVIKLYLDFVSNMKVYPIIILMCTFAPFTSFGPLL